MDRVKFEVTLHAENEKRDHMLENEKRDRLLGRKCSQYGVSLYPCIPVSLYSRMSEFRVNPVSLYPCTPVSLYPCIPVSSCIILYPCITCLCSP